jgi:hypothetical protein
MPHSQAHCMMISSRNKGRLFCFLFFFYFIVYAISPLTYTFPDKKLSENGLEVSKASSKAPLAAKSIRVFLWEIIMEKVAARKDGAHEQTNDDAIIIRKKRALMSESAVTLLPFGPSTAPSNRYSTPAQIIAQSGNTLPVIQATGKGFFPILYAGHAPPLG